MKIAHSKIKADLTALVEKAADFHGHLGPFLVLGIRMGLAVLEEMDLQREGLRELYATIELKPETPFSCVIDGIQLTTKCTIGNQKLRLKRSRGKIIAHFKLQNSNDTVRIYVRDDVMDKLNNKLSEGVVCEKLAWEIAATPVTQLFTIEKE